MKIYQDEIDSGLEDAIRASAAIAYASPVSTYTPNNKQKRNIKLLINENEQSLAENKNQFDLYYLNSILVSTGCLFAAFLVYFFSNLIGKISQTSGLSFPVVLRISMGFNGARYIGMIRCLVGVFMFGVQTFFISKSMTFTATVPL